MPSQKFPQRCVRYGLAASVAFAMLAMLSACKWFDGDDDDEEEGPPAAVTVSVTPANPSVVTGNTLQFTATVSNASSTTVTWQVNNVTGGAAATGTISASGLFTAPAAVPNPATVTVKAISTADTAVSASVTVTITAPPPPPVVSVDVLPATASVQVNGTQHFTATVSNATVTTVTWSVSGAGCAGAACGTITAGGDYTAPAAVPNPSAVTVTATSVEDPTKSDTAAVTITAVPAINPLALLDGRYVLTTIDQERNGFVTGILDFDGAGHITSGAVDLNVPEATAQTTISSGTYTIGADGRGRMTVTVTGVGAVHFSFVVVNTNFARVMYFESTSTGDLFGTLEKQTSASTPSGKFVFRLEGTGPTGRRGYVGVFDLGTHASELDFTEPNPTGFPDGYGTGHVFVATATAGAADSKGRGTLAIDSPETGTLQFAYWVISATRFAIIPLDPVAPIIDGDVDADPASGGVAEKQSAITAGNLAAGSYVYTAMGFDFVGVFDEGGRIVSTGSGSSASVSDDAGPGLGQHLAVASTCNTTVSAAGWSDIFCLPNAHGLRTYFIDGNRAFALAYGNAHLGVGELYKQSAASFATTDVAGDYALLAFGDETANNVTGALTVTDDGDLSGTQDIAEDGDLELDVAVDGTYTLNANGTGATNVSAGGFTNQQSLWVVSPDRVIGFTINDDDKEAIVLDRQDLSSP